MIKNLLNPKWQHADAAIRRQAVEEGRLDAEILFELAKSDPDTGVRSLAVARMQDPQQLIALADSRPDAVNDGIPARLHDLILAADPDSVPDTQTLQRCCELCSDEPLRLSLLLNAPYVALRQMATEGVHQDAALEQCVLNDKAVEVRRAAVSKIENEDTLRRIAKQLRGSDKTTARLADEKRDRLKQHRQEVEQQQLLLSELQAYAEETKPLNEPAIDGHIKQWQTIAAEADDATRDRFEALQAALQPRLEQHRQLLQQERKERKQRENLLQSLAELADQAVQLDPEESGQRLAAAEAGWRELAAGQNPGTHQHFEQDFAEAVKRVRDAVGQQRKKSRIQQRLDAAIASLESRLQAQSLSKKDISKAHEQRDHLFDSIADRQAYEKPLQRIRNLVEKLENRFSDQQAQHKTLQAKLKAHIEALETALNDKALRPALAAHKKAHDLLVSAGDNRPAAFKSLEKRLHHSEPALRELKSWRNWSTDHVREELIKEAIALGDAPPANVEKLAKKLTSLRKRWKELGPLEPGGKAHWEEFDAACTRAHEPVKDKHDADAEARRQHLEQRRAICRRLEELVSGTDWEQPDWHALDKAMGEARRQWNKTGGVPHKAWPAIRKRFDLAISKLDDRLAPERERNFNFRQRLVHEAEELAQEEDSRAATAAARNLRQQWHVSVHSHNRKEKKIWQAFNKAMDQVFEKDRAARQQFRASLDDNQHKAEALCEQLELQSRADDQAIRSQHSDLQQAIDQFTSLNLPKKTRRQLENRFDKACKALKQRISDADKALRNEQLEKLFALHHLCVQMEAIALTDQPEAEAASKLEAQWADAAKPTREKPILHSIEQRYRTALAVINGEQTRDALGDLAANTEHKRTLCIDLEILLHADSPAAESGRRMQRQVELMENAMKGIHPNSPNHIRKLRLDYLSTGPAEPEQQSELEERFSKLFNTAT